MHIKIAFFEHLDVELYKVHCMHWVSFKNIFHEIRTCLGRIYISLMFCNSMWLQFIFILGSVSIRYSSPKRKTNPLTIRDEKSQVKTGHLLWQMQGTASWICNAIMLCGVISITLLNVINFHTNTIILRSPKSISNKRTLLWISVNICEYSTKWKRKSMMYIGENYLAIFPKKKEVETKKKTYTVNVHFCTKNALFRWMYGGDIHLTFVYFLFCFCVIFPPSSLKKIYIMKSKCCFSA